MEVIFCLLSINAIPYPSRKSLVSSNPVVFFTDSTPNKGSEKEKILRWQVQFFIELQLIGPNFSTLLRHCISPVHV